MDSLAHLREANHRLSNFNRCLNTPGLATSPRSESWLDVSLYLEQFRPYLVCAILERHQGSHIERELELYCLHLSALCEKIRICKAALLKRQSDIRSEQHRLASVHQFLANASSGIDKD